jgi:hypothetical protein
MLAMESSADRLEEVARNYQSHGNMTLWKHCEAIDAVTGAQINAAATLALTGKPTMIVTGGSINMVPSMTDVQRQLKWIDTWYLTTTIINPPECMIAIVYG